MTTRPLLGVSKAGGKLAAKSASVSRPASGAGCIPTRMTSRRSIIFSGHPDRARPAGRARRLSTHAAPSSKSLRPRRGQPAQLRRRSRSLQYWPRPCHAAAAAAEQQTIAHSQSQARTPAHQPQKPRPQIISTDVASQTNCSGDNPWRRVTAQTELPPVAISATIRALSSSRHVRRRPAPVNTSNRRTGLGFHHVQCPF